MLRFTNVNKLAHILQLMKYYYFILFKFRIINIYVIYKLNF